MKRKLHVSIRQKDGGKLQARIEERAEGTYAIDLRAWQLGRPTLKAPGALYGTKLHAEAERYARHQLEAIAQNLAVGTAPPGSVHFSRISATLLSAKAHFVLAQSMWRAPKGWPTECIFCHGSPKTSCRRRTRWPRSTPG